MLTDEQIRKISLVFAVIGIAGIVAISWYAAPQRTKVTEITEQSIGKVVEISGSIGSYFSKDGNVFITLRDETGEIQVVMFERTARSQKDVYALQNDDNITVTGKILIYKSEIEIQADEIKRI